MSSNMLDMGSDPADTRAALLDAVEAVVLEKGLRNLSLREVARKAGLSHASPGHHFEDKDGMIAAFAQRGFELFAEAMSADDSGMLNGGAYVRFAIDHPAYFDVMFRSGLDFTKYAGLAEGAHGTFGALKAAVAEVQASGVKQNESTEILAIHLWSVVHGLASLIVDGQLDAHDDIDELIDDVLSVF